VEKRLTSYPLGSLRELSIITLPLLISAMSANVMHFVDRLFLARYSIDAMNAVTSSGTVCYLFSIGAISIASISEVFVGQNNGAHKHSQIAAPVWQMIWFSLLTALVFIPVALFCSECLIPEKLHKHGIPYFKILMLTGPLTPLFCALSGFFAGLGRPHIITIAALIANVFNALLDYFFIFGIKGVLPALGTKGAAIATIFAMVIQCGILFAFFINSKNRQKYNTHKPTLDKKLFMQCVKVGYPNSLGHMIEFAAWNLVFRLAITHGTAHLTVLTVGQSVLILFMFFSEGLNKAVVAVASNIIGSGAVKIVKKLLLSACKLHVLIMLIVSIPMLAFPAQCVKLFNLPNNPELIEQVRLSLHFVWLYMLIDGIAWILAGILIASGDTKYIMWTNATASWLAGVLPIYIGLRYFNISASQIWAIYSIYATVNLISLGSRYYRGHWMTIKLQQL
jgi:MATE family multidrug resistance protein